MLLCFIEENREGTRAAVGSSDDAASEQQLMDAANVVLDDATVTSHVKRIRRKFISVDKDFDRIETAYGMGYRWLA